MNTNIWDGSQLNFEHHIFNSKNIKVEKISLSLLRTEKQMLFPAFFILSDLAFSCIDRTNKIRKIFSVFKSRKSR